MHKLSLVLVLTLTPGLLAQQTSPQVMPRGMSEDYNPFVWKGEDASFALAMLQSDYCGAEMSKFVASKSTSSDVRDLAHSAYQEQTKFYHKLRSLAKAFSIWLPPENQLDKCGEADHVRTLSGIELDKAYLTSLQHTTSDSLSRLQAEMARPEKTNTSALRKLANDHLPIVENLETKAESLANPAAK